ncbi:MAG TPA: cation-translocating P-type ATPase [Elusimicrobiota bacterium]|nr:cation-translocating P-type ATPase [Elusimicrobiota bacterium]
MSAPEPPDSSFARAKWHGRSWEDAAAAFKTNVAAGLSASEAALRLSRDGRNELIDRGAKSGWRILWEQFTASMMMILVAAAVLSALVGDLKDAAAIGAVVTLNALLGFAQEHRAEKAMAALKRLGAPLARVRRDGKATRLAAPQLVAGDVLLLEAGASIAADARLFQAAALKVLEAPLTGEPEAVLKETEAAAESSALPERRCMVYRGTLVAHGRGEGIVVATGMRTELGRIAALMQSAGGEATPLQRRLDVLGNRLAAAALALVAVVFAMGMARGEPLRELFLTAVSLAAAAVPEGLPAVVTIALAIGARRMLARNVLIRKLPAVETLGAVTVICSDKTGTLTEGRMRVSSVEGREASLLLAAALCNDATTTEGDPTEIALAVAAAERGWTRGALEKTFPRVGEAPFDSRRKRMTTVHAVGGSPGERPGWLAAGAAAGFTKGALDGVLERCSRQEVDGRLERLSPESRSAILETEARLASGGARVLALAARAYPRVPADLGPEALESDLVFVGLIGLSDPLRPQARAAVARCRAAGMRPVMITGDHPMTACAVARAAGIDAGSALTGPDLELLTAAELDAAVARTSVFARVAPEHKLKIVDALRRAGHVVAMTGDGVNDAPALKEADIGVAMGAGGTDVAKEAAAMVLLDDNFATIVAAVEEGRVIYDNIRRFVRYLLATNSAEIFVMLLAPLLGMPIPLLPLQILWINLVTDGPTSLTLAVEPASRGVMERPPRPPGESLLGAGLGVHAVWVGALITTVTLGTGYLYWSGGDPAWRSMLFTIMTFAQMGHVLAIRSETESLFSMGLRSNPWLSGAVAATIALQVATLYVPSLRRLLSTVPLHAHDLAAAAGLGCVVFLAVEVEKSLKRRALRREPA